MAGGVAGQVEYGHGTVAKDIVVAADYGFVKVGKSGILGAALWAGEHMVKFILINQPLAIAKQGGLAAVVEVAVGD